MLTPSVKVGRKLELGDLLDGHPGRHARGHRRHGLGRIFTEHVGAQDGVLPAVRDQLAEPGRLNRCYQGIWAVPLR
jgi:hypothetical protein